MGDAPDQRAEQPGKAIPGTYQFSHGLGVGDINGDGRLDVICTGGWWEQPAEGRRHEPWTFHPANLGDACADMYAYDMDGDGKADVLSSSAHNYGIWWHQQKPGTDGNPDVREARPVPEAGLPDARAALRGHQRRRPEGPGHRQALVGARPKGDADPNAPAMLYWFEAKKGKDGVTTFTPHVIDDDSGIGTQFAVADVNGDGLPDVIVSNKKGTFLFEQVRAKK